MSLNKVMIVGNLTRDVEMRYLANGMALAEMGIAVTDRRKDKSGEWIDETTFLDVTAWAKTAEYLAENVQKGSCVFIEGRLKTDSWQDKTSGQKRSKLKVVCDNCYALASRGARQPQTDRAQQTQTADAGGDAVPF